MREYRRRVGRARRTLRTHPRVPRSSARDVTEEEFTYKAATTSREGAPRAEACAQTLALRSTRARESEDASK